MGSPVSPFRLAATHATKQLHDALKLLGPRYAQALGIGSESHKNLHPSKKWLQVYSWGAGDFFFDQCWLIYYNEQAQDLFWMTGEAFEGYFVRCDLAVKSEFNPRLSEYEDNEFYRDFQKTRRGQCTVQIIRVFECHSGGQRARGKSSQESNILRRNELSRSLFGLMLVQWLLSSIPSLFDDF